MSQAQVEFGELPAPTRGQRHDWDAIVAQLAERPGEWARVFRGVPSTSAYDHLGPALSRRGCKVEFRRPPTSAAPGLAGGVPATGEQRREWLHRHRDVWACWPATPTKGRKP